MCYKIIVANKKIKGRTIGNGLSPLLFMSNVWRRFVVHGPSARMCRLKCSSWGAEVSVNGWYSFSPIAWQAILTHWPDLYSKFKGRSKVKAITSETIGSVLLYWKLKNWTISKKEVVYWIHWRLYYNNLHWGVDSYRFR